MIEVSDDLLNVGRLFNKSLVLIIGDETALGECWQMRLVERNIDALALFSCDFFDRCPVFPGRDLFSDVTQLYWLVGVEKILKHLTPPIILEHVE